MLSNGLESVLHRVRVLCMGAVGAHTVFKPKWSAPGSTSSTWPKWTTPEYSTRHSDDASQMSHTLDVKHSGVWYRSNTVIAPKALLHHSLHVKITKPLLCDQQIIWWWCGKCRKPLIEVKSDQYVEERILNLSSDFHSKTKSDTDESHVRYNDWCEAKLRLLFLWTLRNWTLRYWLGTWSWQRDGV